MPGRGAVQKRYNIADAEEHDMAFGDFKYPAVVGSLGLTERTLPNLFADVPLVQPSALLLNCLGINIPLATGAHSESARITWLVGPVLSDLWARYDGRLSVNPGVEFEADPAAKLTGYCDFIVSRGPQRPVIGPPVLLIFEAKRDSIPDGLGQCIAGMVGAQRYNQRNNTPVDPVYGCVTTGSLWKFLRLSGTVLTNDLTEHALTQADRLLGILTHIVGPPPAQPAAA
ncbi:MAG: hypothetical protein U0792_19330 [Gemmataceae bacterium]